MTRTPAQRNAAYRTRKAERIARMKAAIKLLCDCADQVQEVSGGTVQHAALLLATVEGRNALAKTTNT